MKFKKSPASGTLRVSSGGKGKVQIIPIITHVVFGLICFLLGVLINMTGNAACPSCPECEPPLPKGAPVPRRDLANALAESDGSNGLFDARFPPSLRNFMHNFGTVPREDMNSLLEIGVPLDELKAGDTEDAIILYPHTNTMPTSVDSLTGMNATAATENCMSVKVILQDNKPKKRQCMVIMPQWESLHVHKFMRLDKGTAKKPESKDLPLRYVSASHRDNGAFNGVPDMAAHTVPFHKNLIEYLGQLERVTKELQAELLKMNTKTIIVLVCNHGQSELLHNFVCNARAKGLDLGQIFLFATDEKTHQLAQSLGLASFHDESVFMDMPEQAAGGYGDRIFAKMMMAKVYCVHLVLHCGFNVLFQDVDVVWNRNPLPYLEGPDLEEWDLMFQDDGARSNRYAPYSPNTGRSLHCATPLFRVVAITLLTNFFIKFLQDSTTCDTMKRLCISSTCCCDTVITLPR